MQRSLFLMLILLFLSFDQVDDKRFDIELHDRSRTYHIQDDAGGSARWVDAFSQFLEAWQNYYEDQTGTTIKANRPK